MNFLLKASLALLMAGGLTSQALGQFPWSGEKAAAPAVHKTGSITWKTDLPEALKLAQEQRKLVFLHFSGTHCPPCRKLEDNVLNRNDVAVTMLSRYVPVFIVVEQAPDLVTRFHVREWPTDVIIDAEGRELARHVSPQDSREFIKRISTIAAKHHAGQSATIANVRVAVAADVTESNAPVQHTAADDRPPTQSQRAESKIVPNPHAREGRLPAIVARNTKPQSTSVDDEGFSPPNQRRKPPIVRKAREAVEEAVAVDPDRVAVEDESTEADVAPWRKNAQAKKRPAQKEPIESEPQEDPEAEAEEPADETKADGKMADEPEADESSETDSTEKPVEAKTEEPASEAVDELPAPRSRFGGMKEEEAEVEAAPAKDVGEKVAKESSAGEEEASKPAEEAPEQGEPEAEVEPAPPKSRFSRSEGAPAKTAEEETSTPEAKEGVEPPEESKAQEPEEGEEKQAAAKAEEDKPEQEAGAEPAEEMREDGDAVPAEEKQEVTKKAAPQAATEDESAKSNNAPAKPSAKTRKPSKSKVAAEPSEETDEAAEAAPAAKTEASGRPRGLAKIARSGKYVLGGHCCVTLLETEELVAGNPQFGAIHRGRIFLFSSAEARKKFLDNPDDYSPMLTGYDPVLYADRGELVDGSPKILGKLKDGRVISFSSEETYKKFAADYSKQHEKSPYVESIRAAMKETNGGRHLR